MDNLSIDDIYGLLPNEFVSNENNLVYFFKNLEPEPENNIVMRYKKSLKDFNFEIHSNNYQKYFSDIDKITYNKNLNNFKKLDKNNFSPPKYSEWFFLSVITIICIILFSPIILIITFFIKKMRKKS